MCCTGLNKAYMCRTRSFNDVVIFSCVLFIVLSEQIVYIKPPWTLRDVLQCLKKHWVAVFGQVVPRRKLQTVLNLIDFFKSGMFSCKSECEFHGFQQSLYEDSFPRFSPHKQTQFGPHIQVLLQLKISRVDCNRIPFALRLFDESYRGGKIIEINEMANRIPLVR